MTSYVLCTLFICIKTPHCHMCWSYGISTFHCFLSNSILKNLLDTRTSNFWKILVRGEKILDNVEQSSKMYNLGGLEYKVSSSITVFCHYHDPPPFKLRSPLTRPRNLLAAALMRKYYCLILFPLLTSDQDHSNQPLLKFPPFIVILFALITTVRQLLPFLGYIKAEESSGVNTEGGLSGPELEMLKAGGMNVTIVLLLFTLQILSFDALQCWATILLYLVSQ